MSSSPDSSFFPRIFSSTTPTLAPSPPLTTNGSPTAAGTGTRFDLAAMMSDQRVIICLIVVTVLLLMAFIVWLVIRIRRASLQSLVLSRAKVIDLAGVVPVRIPADTAPATVNGQEFTYSFWIYLQGVDPTIDHKLVFLRSPDASNDNLGTFPSLDNANPIVFLDKVTNKLYISLLTTNSKDGLSMKDLASVSDPMITHITSVINYLPLQRWVNVCISVQDASVTMYVDGDIYSVFSVPDPKEDSGVVRPVIRATVGNLQLGDASNKARAHASKLEFFNYALTHKQVKALYSTGPTNSMLSRAGLPPYGLRSPIYRLDDN